MAPPDLREAKQRKCLSCLPLHRFSIAAVSDVPVKAPPASRLWPAVGERVREASHWLATLAGRGLRRTASLSQLRTRRDRVLAQQLAAAFERDLEEATLHGVQFYVRGGVVTLYGTVAHVLDQKLLVDLVRSVPHVEGVVAHLHVLETSRP